SVNAQFLFVSPDDVKRSEPMAPLVFDKVAVGAVEPPRQSPERNAPALAGTSQCNAQTTLRRQRASARLSLLAHPASLEKTNEDDLLVKYAPSFPRPGQDRRRRAEVRGLLRVR